MQPQGEARLKAVVVSLESAIKRAEMELKKLSSNVEDLEQKIDCLEGTVAMLESPSSKIITLKEYGAIRKEIVDLCKKRAEYAVKIRNKNESIRLLCSELKATQEALKSLSKPKRVRGKRK